MLRPKTRRARARRAAGAAIALVAAVLLALPATHPPAAAHAEMVASDPAAGSTVEPGGETIEMQFVALSPDPEMSISVSFTPEVDEGEEAPEPEVTTVAGNEIIFTEGTTVEVPVEPMEAGSYHVSWEALGEDEDESSGAFDFTVAGGSEPNRWGPWLLWGVVIGVPLVVLFRPGRRRRSTADGSSTGTPPRPTKRRR